MRPALAFLGGALLIWIVANGKAAALWGAIVGQPATATRPPDPSTGDTPPSDLPPSPFPPGGPIKPPTGPGSPIKLPV